MNKITALALTTLLAAALCACDPNSQTADIDSYPKYGHCAIDSPAKNAEISSGDDFLVGGWAFDRANNTIPEVITVYFKNVKTGALTDVNAVRNSKRPDVAAVYKNPALEQSGFNAAIKKGLLPAGDYEIIILQVDQKSGAIVCKGAAHQLKIK